jgi:uncharacterized membrane protein (Fun14 family)
LTRRRRRSKMKNNKFALKNMIEQSESKLTPKPEYLLENENEKILRQIGEDFGRDLVRAYGPARIGEAINVALGIQSLIMTLATIGIIDIKDEKFQKRLGEALETLRPVTQGILKVLEPALKSTSVTIHVPKSSPPSETKK